MPNEQNLVMPGEFITSRHKKIHKACKLSRWRSRNSWPMTWFQQSDICMSCRVRGFQVDAGRGWRYQLPSNVLWKARSHFGVWKDGKRHPLCDKQTLCYLVAGLIKKKLQLAVEANKKDLLGWNSGSWPKTHNLRSPWILCVAVKILPGWCASRPAECSQEQQ